MHNGGIELYPAKHNWAVRMHFYVFLHYRGTVISEGIHTKHENLYVLTLSTSGSELYTITYAWLRTIDATQNTEPLAEIK